MKRATDRFVARAALAFALGLGAGACSAPTVNLRAAQLENLSTSAIKLGLDFGVSNPNAFALPMTTIAWDLDLFKRPAASGTAKARDRIAANSSAVVSMPLSIPVRTLSLAVTDLLSARSIPWGLGGAVSFNSPAGPLTANFARSGAWSNPLKNLRVSLPLGELSQSAAHARLEPQTL